MQVGFIRGAARASALSSALLLSLAVPVAHGQQPPDGPPAAAAPGALATLPEAPPSDAAPADPPRAEAAAADKDKDHGPQTPQTPPTPPTTPPTNQAQEPNAQAEQGAAATAATATLAAPNMMGDLLGAGRSTAFFYQRTRGNVFINGTGATSIFNPKVADNNSPVPEDRVAFRYNYFSRALAVTGDSGEAFFDPSLGLSRFGAPRFRGVVATRKYDVQDYTFSGEKTFFDGMFSVEVRVPFSHTVGHDQNLSVARVSRVGEDQDFESGRSIIGTEATPQDTLGTTDTEFGDMMVIFKALAYQSKTFYFSGGASVTVPTAPDTRVKVNDFLGDNSDNDIEIERRREFNISNDTWALSPFLAALWAPNDRFFAHGFLQFDIPLNHSTIFYSEAPVINTEPSELNLTPLFTTDSINEQTLMQVDVGTGYWLMHDRENGWLTGIAPTLELHYTTTLDNADIRTLPVAQQTSNLAVVGPQGQPISEPHPQVGNLRNRVDILDMTVGATFELGSRATVAAGVAFPLLQGDNRTFDYEVLLEVNYYFGPGRRSPAPQNQ